MNALYLRTGRMILVISAAVLVFGAGVARADTYDFEGYTPGTVNGQNGWTVEDQWGNTQWGDDPSQLDQEIQDDGTGNTVWRASNAVTASGYSAQPYSPSTALAAGESGSALWNDQGPDHTSPYDPPHPGAYAGTNLFTASFDFISAPGAAQTGLAMSISPSAKQSSNRMSYVQLYDDGANGIDVYFYETGSTSDVWGSSATWIEVASNLSYTDYHNVAFEMEFVDGLDTDDTGNDIVKVYVDGSLAHTGSSWETYFKSGDDFASRIQAVDSLMFNIGGTAVPANDGNGFYFDNVQTTAVPVPGAVILALLGLAGLSPLRRRV